MRDREITIVKDYWDLKSDRIQIITGLFLATASLLALWLLADRDFSNSIAHVYSVSLIDVYSTTQSTAIARALTELDANYLTVLRLFLHVMTGIFAGLTAMEVTKLFGNRRGVMHAVWVALIYAVCPTCITLLYSGDGLSILGGALFSTIALYLDLRYRFLEEEAYLISSSVFITISMCFDVVSGLTGLIAIMLSRLILRKLTGKILSKSFKLSYFALLLPPLFVLAQNQGMRYGQFSLAGIKSLLLELLSTPEHLTGGARTLSTIFFIVVIVLGVSTALRIIGGSLWLRPLIFLITWLLTNIFVASFYILGAHYLADTSVNVAALIFYCSAPLSILLVLTALPVIDAINKPLSIALTFTGCLCLSFIFTLWGVELYSAQNRQVKIQEKFRSYETITHQTAAGYPGKNLVLVGQPEVVLDYVKDHKMHFSKRRTARLFEAVGSGRKNDLTLVSALGYSSTNLPDKAKETVYLLWNDKKAGYEPISYKGGFNFSMLADDETASMTTVEPEDIPVLKVDDFKELAPGSPYVEFLKDRYRLTAGSRPFILKLPPVDLNPSATGLLEIEGYISNNKEANLKLIWKGSGSAVAEAPITIDNKGRIYADLYQNPEWLRIPDITTIGIKLEPGSYYLDLRKLSFHDPYAKELINEEGR